MKKILITFLVLILAIVIGAVTYVLTFDVNSYKGQIEKALQDATGYNVVIRGDMELSKSLMPTLVINNIEVKNADGFSKPLFFKAQKAEVSFDLVAFFKDIINVQKVVVSDVDLNLQVNEVGFQNWTRLQKKSERDDKKEVSRPSLSKAGAVTPQAQTQVALVTFSRVNVLFENAKEKIEKTIQFPTLSVKSLVNIDGSVVYEKERFSFSGSIKNLLSVISTRRNLNFSFDVKGLEGSAKVSGVCRDIMRFKDDITLNVSMTGKNLNKTYAFFNTQDNRIPATAFSVQVAARLLKKHLLLEGAVDLTDDGVNLSYNIEQDLKSQVGKGRINIDIIKPDFVNQYGIQPFTTQFSYNLTLGQQLEILNLTSMFDETDLDGTIRVDLTGEKPMISADLRSHYLKLGNLLAEKKVEKKQQTVSQDETKALFSSAPIALDWMQKVNANINLTIDNFAANGMFARYPLIATNIRLDNGQLDARLLEGSRMAGGQIIGKLVIDAQPNQQASWDLEFVGEGLMFNNVNAWKKQLRSGTLDVNLFLTGKGNTQEAILSSLNGQALFAASQVEILSPIVSELFAEASTKSAYGIPQDLFVKCGVVNAEVKNGVIWLDKKAALETSRFNMLIDGDVNLDKETIDMRFIPQKTSVRSQLGNSLIAAVGLKGTLLEPQPTIETDVSAILANILPVQEEKISSDKKSLLDAYTVKKEPEVEEVSVCRVAAEGMQLKTIDTYLGRLPKVQTVEVQQEPVPEPQQTKAQKIGREFLDSLSDVLNDKVSTAEVKQVPVAQ